MSLPNQIPLWLYEATFLALLVLLIVMALHGEIFKYGTGLMCLYMCLCAIRRSKRTFISTEGKSVFITGCDSGFGHATAVRLCEKGFRVFAGCLLPEAQGAATLKEKCPNNLFIVPLDVTKDESVKNAENFVRGHLGETCLWGFVNNAGVMTLGDIELTSLETYQRVFDVNTFGMLRVTKMFLPLLRQSKGRISVTSSVTAQKSIPTNACYGASKVALEYICDCLRMEMRKFGVHVSIIEPGNFGGNTDIFSGDNRQRVYTTAAKDWENLSDELKSVYSKDYSQDLYEQSETLDKMSKCRNVDPVVNAIEDCLLSSQPKIRKVVQGGPYPLDVFVVIPLIMRYMPDTIADWFLCKMTRHSDTRRLYK